MTNWLWLGFIILVVVGLAASLKFVPRLRSFCGGVIVPFLTPIKPLFCGHFLRFLAWFGLVIVVGLMTAMLPFLLLLASGTSEPKDAFIAQLYAGTLISFCVPVLAEGLLLLHERAESNLVAADVRKIAWTFGLALILVSMAIVGFESAMGAVKEPRHITPAIHVILAVSCILSASYFFCFRLPPETVEKVAQKRDAEVKELETEAKAVVKDGTVKL